MLTSHELFGALPSALVFEILESTFFADKQIYGTVLNAVAEARNVRVTFFLKKPRSERHRDVSAMLGNPRLEGPSALLLRSWLTKTQSAMLIDFLNGLGIVHDEGAVDEFPATVEDLALKVAVDDLLGKYSEKNVTIYLHSLLILKEVDWANLVRMIEQDQRLRIK